VNTGGGEVVDAPVGSEAGQAEWVSGTLKPGKADAVLPNRWGAGYEKRNRSHTRTHTPRIPVGGVAVPHPLDPKQARPNGSAGHSNPARQTPYSHTGGGLGMNTGGGSHWEWEDAVPHLLGNTGGELGVNTGGGSHWEWEDAVPHLLGNTGGGGVVNTGGGSY